MRLDIYQHVVKDIDEIENIVSGNNTKSTSSNGSSLKNYFVSIAYAENGLSPKVEQAAMRRKDRRIELLSWQTKGAIGENKEGLLEKRKPELLISTLDQLIESENNDRLIIYGSIAKNNGTSVEDVQKLYAERLQKDAPVGCPIQVLNQSTGKFEWQIKQ